MLTTNPRDVEIKYVVRTLVSNLRVGAGWRSVVVSRGRAAAFSRRRFAPGICGLSGGMRGRAGEALCE